MPAAEIYDEALQMQPCVTVLCRLTMELAEEYSRRKLERNLLDFNDLERYAIRLLEEHADLRERIQGGFDEILVDEYQDTNGVQARLFELLSNGHNLFMVGDVKQSIYGFRNAQPRYFMEKYKAYAFGGGEQGEKILLSHNFRSSAGVLAAVNAIFERMMREEAGGVDYNDEHRLVYGNRSVADWDRPVEIHLLDTALEPDDSLSEEELQLTASQREAVFVAGALRRLVEEQRPEVFDKRLGGTRPLAYSDVVILMRKTAGVAPVFAEQLALRGIPVYTQESGGYFLTVEIATILSFLQIIDNPLQDIPLLAVLRSPLFSVDDNTVAAWRAERRYGSLYGMLKRCGDPRAQAFIEQLERYMDLARYEPVETLVRRLVFETGYYAFAGGLPNGAERMANLRLLCERAHVFEQDGYKGVSAFVAYIREMIESGKEYTRAKIVGENENAVTIMTIHKSKGLEFPVVFLAGCGQRFNKTDFRQKMVFDERLGLATDVIDMDRHLKYAPYIKKAVVQRRQGEMVSEEMRLLYVALTRAQYKLVAVGSAAGAAGKLETWQRMPRLPFVFANGNSYLEWLGTAADRSLFAVHAAAEVLLGGCAETKHAVSDGAAQYGGALYEEVDRRLRYVYPFEACRFIPSKRSISEMVDRQSEQLLLHRLQTAPDTLTAAQRGTVIHYVLQNIDLGRTGSEAEIQAQLAEMVRRGVLEPAHAGLVDTAALHAFFSSALGMRMKRSGTVYREFRFCVDVPACELMDTELEEPVLVQGVIDCCFAEDDGFVIIDYKTGSLHEKYKLQLELYRRCLALATGRPVKETHIYPLI